MTFKEAFDILANEYPEKMAKFLSIYSIGDPDAYSPEMLCGPAAMMLFYLQEQSRENPECNVPEYITRAIVDGITRAANGSPIDGISERAMAMQLENAMQFI